MFGLDGDADRRHGFVALARGDVWRSPVPHAALLLVALFCSTKNQQGTRYFLTLYAVWTALAGAATWVRLDVFRRGLARDLVVAVLATGSLSLTLDSVPDFPTHTSPRRVGLGGLPTCASFDIVRYV
jgi:hypothetical protein